MKMNDISNCKPTIFIDQKKNRIRVFKSTLNMLGYPAFIQLLVNPESRNIAVRSALAEDVLAHRVRWKKLGDMQSYELYSSSLIHKIQTICKDWEHGKSYRLLGSLYHSENIAVSDLREAILVQGNKEG